MMDRDAAWFNHLRYGRPVMKHLLALLVVWVVTRDNRVFTVLAGYTALFLFFFRNSRVATPDPSAFASPAHSRLMVAIPSVALGDPTAPGPFMYLHGYLSVFDRHYFAAPTAATVVSVSDARTEEDVERVRMEMRDDRSGKVYYVDHAVSKVKHGAYLMRMLACKRVVVDTAPGKRLRQGEKYGFIRFGSEVAMYVPMTMVGQFIAQVGTKVSHGQSLFYV